MSIALTTSTSMSTSGYPDSMRELIAKVEATRPERLKSSPPRMSAEEREKLLREWHPDYKAGTKRPLSIGPSKGELVPHEVADLLEAYPLISPEEVDLSQIDYDVDVLVIGGGGAGTVAALWAYYEGLPPERILIATKLRWGDSNSIMAQGGIQAADRPEDSPAIHYLDIIGGGHYANKPELVRALASDGPMIIKWHESLGVMYDKNPDGSFVEKHGGGTSRMRMHSAKDYTGMEIMRALRDEARNIGIPVVEFAPAVELLMDDLGQVAGAVLFNLETGQYLVVRAKATVLATGGFGRLHIQGFPTTNHYGATADGLVLAYRVGAKLRDMDAVQYHPTGVAYPEALVGQLVTEKVRGMGAMPVNRHGEAFVYPLEPRDVESAALIRECYGRGNGVETPTGMRGVWLDSPMIEELQGAGAIKRELAAMWRMFNRFGIDMTKEPILVFPTLHYQNGGVEIDEHGWTGVPGLFAGGEVEGGVHGKNRLMGNSLLDYNVFGRRAGIAAARHAKGKGAKLGKLTLDHIVAYSRMLEEAGVSNDRKAPLLLPEYRGERALARSLKIRL
ncbi:MAG: FAD-binding protein [Candidatus Acetothermia bacterium]|jgi:succinate dehydrogenase / fumarate reductase flavoprotein subunit|nr:FAD-binding protein [Candidatus Acetothermia bacterium]MDH7505968.1 FAD-binding protein [Candidatus Acetothermia bacterium]